MKKSVVIIAMLLTGCASIGSVKDKPQLYDGKLPGDHASLARCVVNRLQADNRWVISSLQYNMWEYPDIAASEIYAYALHQIPDMYARSSPLNPDAVFDYSVPQPVSRTHAQSPYSGPEYAFTLLLKRTDNTTALATLKGNKYEGRIAWESLQICASAVKKPE